MTATRPTPVYLFRDQSFSGGGDTVVCVAAREVVVSVFGSGGPFDSAGLAAEFEGCAVFRDDASEQVFLGVWGARKASRFRSRLRADGVPCQIRHERPPGRLVMKSYGRAAKERL